MSQAVSMFPRSSVLVLGPNSVHSLVPATLISQAEALLASHRIDDALNLVDQQRRKLESNITIDEAQAEELRYVYQRIGFQCFSETLFEQAGQHLFNGELDPRLLVSYYPDLRGSLFTPDDSTEVFAGIADHMPTEDSVEDIIATNLVMNYSPHLSPNTREAPITVELRKVLILAARDMLESFLKRCRNKSRVDSSFHTSAPVVDTVLAKLYAQTGNKVALHTLLQEKHEIVLSEVESTLRDTGNISALCILYKERKLHVQLLDTWSKLIDGEWTDEEIQDPTSLLIALLAEKKDRALSRKWGVWLTKRDPDRGLKLLTSSKRRDKPEEDEALLSQIQESNAAAGSQYLEHLVIQRRNTSRDLHTKFAISCVQQLSSFLEQDAVAKLWRAKTSSYSSSKTVSTQSYFAYFVSTTPDSESKRCRIKTVLFLQGSSLYDLETVKVRLMAHEKMLKLEIAILHAKMQNHRDAMAALVNDLRDGVSAESYCANGGEVVPTSTALSIAEHVPEIQMYRHLYATPPAKPAGVDKKTLVKILLEVYMSDGDMNADKVARLVESQGATLEMEEVIGMMPPSWSLNVVSSFLARSLRRSLHQRHQAQIVKALCVDQNMKVKERVYPILREEGMVVEEASGADDDDDDGSVDEKEEVFNEKAELPAVDHHVAILSAGREVYESEWGEFQSHEPQRT